MSAAVAPAPSSTAPPRKSRAVAAVPPPPAPVGTGGAAGAASGAAAAAAAPPAKKPRASRKAVAAATADPAIVSAAAAADPAAAAEDPVAADPAVTTAAPKKKRARSKSPDADGAATDDAAAAAPAGGGKPARTRRPSPSSPRTTAQMLNPRGAAPGSEPLTPLRIKAATAAVARNFETMRQIQKRVAESKTGKWKAPNGREYDQAAVREMCAALQVSVRRLPPACYAASRRRAQPPLSDAEKVRRQEVLTERVTRGANELANAVGCPALAALLMEQALAKIRSRDRLPSPEAGLQISAPFLITDQFRKFVEECNFGNGLPKIFGLDAPSITAINGAAEPDRAIAEVEAAAGIDVAEKLGFPKGAANRAEGVELARRLADPRTVLRPLLGERGVVTSPILMSLMARYVAANGLKDPETGRIRVDDNMRKYFGEGTNTRFVYLKHDYTPEVPPGTKVEPYNDHDKSALERIRARPFEDGAVVPYDGATHTRAMLIAIATFFRISDTPAKFQGFLKNERLSDLANGIKMAF
jgi:hypothetical protein